MKKRDSICWECANSVPNPKKKIGCEWSCHAKEVPGWTATPHWSSTRAGTPFEMSYRVYECPKFIRG